MAGNAIDFCMKVLGLSFHDATREITRPSRPLASSDYDPSVTGDATTAARPRPICDGRSFREGSM
jgi:hypothetical protein